MTSVLREPLVHFLAVGALVVGVDGALRPSPAAPAPHPTVIAVDDGVRADLVEQLGRALARPPSDQESEQAIEHWVRTEVLVREARRLGLDRADPVVRDRLARKMAYVQSAVEVPPEPPEVELRALYDAAIDEFRHETKLTVRHLFTGEDRARAESLRDRWRSGEDPRSLEAEPAPGGPVLRGRTPDRLTELLGAGFTGAVLAQEDRIEVVQSSLGWHVAQVEQRREGRQLAFEEARDRLALRWRTAWVESATESAYDELRQQYRIEGWP